MEARNKQRMGIAALVLSAAGFTGIVQHESYTEKAIIPTKNDRPTVGFGSTFRDDGTPVQMGDKITPPQAVARSLAHIQKDEARLKQCVKMPLSQSEYDTLVDFSYQYGVPTTCNSSIVAAINRGDYASACRGYLLYKKAGGFDCSIPGNKVCGGVWARSQRRYADCMGAL